MVKWKISSESTEIKVKDILPKIKIEIKIGNKKYNLSI
jgi:hypothetical protein